MNNLDKIVQAIKAHNKFLIATHSNPDGDAIGSSLALYLLLKKIGKDAHVVMEDQVPASFRFLPGAEYALPISSLSFPYDCSCILDCGQFERTATAIYQNPHGCGTLINIDHHITSRPWAHLNWVDQTASSTAEMIHQIIIGCIERPNLDMACNIYTGLMTDTGSFRYSNTTAKVLFLAGQLVEMGVNQAHIASHVYENVPYETLKLLGLALGRIGITQDGLIAWISVTRADLEASKTTWEATEEFVSYPRSIPSVAVALFFKETSEGTVKVSYRSRGRIDVSHMALKYGGGGHMNAAGCTISGQSLDKVMNTVIEEIHLELLKNHDLAKLHKQQIEEN